jgi:hypothetical protein
MADISTLVNHVFTLVSLLYLAITLVSVEASSTGHIGKLVGCCATTVGDF